MKIQWAYISFLVFSFCMWSRNYSKFICNILNFIHMHTYYGYIIGRTFLNFLVVIM